MQVGVTGPLALFPSPSSLSLPFYQKRLVLPFRLKDDLLDVIDTRPVRAAQEVIVEFLHRFFVSLDIGLDPTVFEVPDHPAHLVRRGGSLREKTKSNPLNEAGNKISAGN